MCAPVVVDEQGENERTISHGEKFHCHGVNHLASNAKSDQMDALSCRVAINCADALLIYKIMPVTFIREVMHMTRHTGVLGTITSLLFMCRVTKSIRAQMSNILYNWGEPERAPQ